MKQVILTITEEENNILDVELELGNYSEFEALKVIKKVYDMLLEEQIRLN